MELLENAKGPSRTWGPSPKTKGFLKTDKDFYVKLRKCHTPYKSGTGVRLFKSIH